MLLGVGGVLLGLTDWRRTGGKLEVMIGIAWLAIGVGVMVTKRGERL